MDALGIINFEDSSIAVEGLSDHRPIPAMAFLGRYRIIDFILSNMTNSGIEHVQVYAKEKPRNLFEHLGSGSHYNINSKRGKLRILYGEKTFSTPLYNNDIANFILNMQYIEKDLNPYVIVAPSYFVYNIDFNPVLETHIKSKADVTVLYTNTQQAKEEFFGCDTVRVNSNSRKILGFGKNRGNRKNEAISLECYIMSKQLFIDLVKRGAEASSLYWFKDVLRDCLKEVDMRGYLVRGFVACINSLPDYFKTSMLLRNWETAKNLFVKDWPIYTKTGDSSPTKYAQGSKVTSSIIANGSHIEGTVSNSIVSRNVIIRKNAVVKDSIILPGAYIGENVKLDHVVVDKYAMIHHVKALKGDENNPVYVSRRDRI